MGLISCILEMVDVHLPLLLVGRQPYSDSAAMAPNIPGDQSKKTRTIQSPSELCRTLLRRLELYSDARKSEIGTYSLEEPRT